MADGEAEEAAPAEEPPAKKRKKKKDPKPDANFTVAMQHFYKELVLGFIKVVPDEERQRRLAELRCAGGRPPPSGRQSKQTPCTETSICASATCDI